MVCPAKISAVNTNDRLAINDDQATLPEEPEAFLMKAF